MELAVGSVSQCVAVNANDIHLSTTDASVSAVLDETYVRNMPLNGRSFQDLILLTRGCDPLFSPCLSRIVHNVVPNLRHLFTRSEQRTVKHVLLASWKEIADRR